MKKYYSEENRTELLELSDRRILWSIDNIDDDNEFFAIRDDLLNQFEESNGTRVYLCGRSGRHVCVDDTEENENRYEELKENCNELQEALIRYFNK